MIVPWIVSYGAALTIAKNSENYVPGQLQVRHGDVLQLDAGQRVALARLIPYWSLCGAA